MTDRNSGGGASPSLSLSLYLSLYGSSVKGTWREGSIVGDPGG